MQIVTVLKNGKVKGRYLVDVDSPKEAENLISKYKPGYKYSVDIFDFSDLEDVYEMFWEDDDPRCETCKHEYEQRKEEKISVAEFKGVNYRIPEKHWTFVALNLRHYQEYEK